MKHYKELTDIEDVSIDLDVLASTVRVISNGAPESNSHDVHYALHNVTDQLELLSKRLRCTFDVLFNEIREEEKADEAKAGKAKSKKDSF